MRPPPATHIMALDSGAMFRVTPHAATPTFCVRDIQGKDGKPSRRIIENTTGRELTVGNYLCLPHASIFVYPVELKR